VRRFHRWAMLLEQLILKTTTSAPALALGILHSFLDEWNGKKYDFFQWGGSPIRSARYCTIVRHLTTNGSNKQSWKPPVIHQPSCHGADREVDTLVPACGTFTITAVCRWVAQKMNITGSPASDPAARHPRPAPAAAEKKWKINLKCIEC